MSPWGFKTVKGTFPASGGNIPGRPVIFPGVFGGRVIADCQPVALSLSLLYPSPRRESSISYGQPTVHPTRTHSLRLVGETIEHAEPEDEILYTL